MTLLSRLLAPVAVVLAAALPAGAATMKAVVTGTIFGSYGAIGAYGGPGLPMDGQTITATFRYDTGSGLTGGVPGGEDLVYGGPNWGIPYGPTVSASFSIGGTTTALTWDTDSVYYACDLTHCGMDQWYMSALSYGTDTAGALKLDLVKLWLYDSVADLFPADLETPFTLTVPADVEYNSGYFETSYYWIGYGYAAYANGNFTVNTITVSAVPLPATALLMLGALGTLPALRRRRRR